MRAPVRPAQKPAAREPPETQVGMVVVQGAKTNARYPLLSPAEGITGPLDINTYCPCYTGLVTTSQARGAAQPHSTDTV